MLNKNTPLHPQPPASRISILFHSWMMEWSRDWRIKKAQCHAPRTPEYRPSLKTQTQRACMKIFPWLSHISFYSCNRGYKHVKLICFDSRTVIVAVESTLLFFLSVFRTSVLMADYKLRGLIFLIKTNHGIFADAGQTCGSVRVKMCARKKGSICCFMNKDLDLKIVDTVSWHLEGGKKGTTRPNWHKRATPLKSFFVISNYAVIWQSYFCVMFFPLINIPWSPEKFVFKYYPSVSTLTPLYLTF